MSVERRDFLQGSLASLLLLAVPAGVLAPEIGLGAQARVPATRGRRILLLRFAGDEAFARPALETLVRNGYSPLESIELTKELVASPGALAGVLGRQRDARLVGMMDDCTHTLLEETLRDLGGAVLCRGYHRGRLDASTASRHAFMTTRATRGIGRALARVLAAREADFLVQEHASYVEDEGDGRDVVSLPAAGWPAALGTGYALMAAGTWTAGAVSAEERGGASAEAPHSQAFASLVAEI